ncbi:arsenosugar biosynthesis radical SAM (seleno)protein ArsS [Anthocerotibacter panamensis]|uniref:arsenosugar biosynthesis radical SAM (seleno)protein ArsS n=1 Tax=Anthocerotibacter panamensis TaxID=2857077 RepID=UPI001C402604|nr:arsenosugar biosynthesis radical SAM (seleno)protein ArsS [Anthocerotibacter panamensis]
MPETSPTLLKRSHPLASADSQRQVLDQIVTPSFAEAVAGAGYRPLKARSIEVLQINLGKRCNQTCRHCHVDAGPDRPEVMSEEVLEACLNFLAARDIPTVDITGGAPELHPGFRVLVERARALGRQVIDRCNLTITRLPNYAYLPEFLARHHVEVVASLPAYGIKQTDLQRGGGVFSESILALQHFNELGYGVEGTGLVLNLVTNPVGAFLPGNQVSLEREWKRELKRRHGIVFNKLYTITNMPISRFLEFLETSQNLESYMERLIQAFNPQAVAGLMCRSTLSVGWDGKLYDCDFNQMLDMALPQHMLDIQLGELEERVIQTGAHCFGCTAGAGSSCGGVTTG